MPHLCKIERSTWYELSVAVTTTVALLASAQAVLFGAFTATRDALFFESYCNAGA